MPEPPEDHPDGLALNPMGTAGDSCTFQLRFMPSGHGVRWARLDFAQADSVACTIDDMARFRGRGRAGTLTIASNASEDVIFVPLARRMAGCP